MHMIPKFHCELTPLRGSGGKQNATHGHTLTSLYQDYSVFFHDPLTPSNSQVFENTSEKLKSMREYIEKDMQQANL